MYKGNTKKIEHILHPLNLSRSKNSYTFQKSERFHLEKRFVH